ncbi:MAG: hypothetical protein PWP24_1333 [Clostridiales bacterium]|nr:hypothetical protein [Clostridiales bacterium]
MKGKEKLYYVLMLNLPVAIAIALTAQLVTIHTIILPLFILNLLLAYVLAFFIGMLLPIEKIGVGFANFFKLKPGLVFGLVVNVAINFVYVTIICLVMTYFNVVLLQKLPFAAFAGGFVSTYPVIYFVGYLVSFVANQPSLHFAQRLTSNE